MRETVILKRLVSKAGLRLDQIVSFGSCTDALGMCKEAPLNKGMSWGYNGYFRISTSFVLIKQS